MHSKPRFVATKYDRRSLPRIGAVALLVLLAAPFDAFARSCDSKALARDELVAELQEGGLFIVFRHAKKEGAKAAESEWQRVRKCSSMEDQDRKRRLSAEGVEQAAMIGHAMRAAKVKVGEVLTSEYCRAMETGLVAFGKATEMKELDLDFVLSGGSPKIAEFLAARTVEPTTNTVVVTHKQRFYPELGILDPKQGEAFVLDLECPEGKRLLGRIPDSGW